MTPIATPTAQHGPRFRFAIPERYAPMRDFRRFNRGVFGFCDSSHGVV